MGATPEWSRVVLSQEQMSPSSDTHVLHQATRTVCRENVPVNQLVYQGPSQDMCQSTAPWSVLIRERKDLCYSKHHSITRILSALGMGGWEAQMPSNTLSIPVLLCLAEWLWNSLWSVCAAFLSTPIITTSCLSTTHVCCPPKTMPVESHLHVRRVDLLMFASVLPKSPYETHAFRSFGQGGDHKTLVVISVLYLWEADTVSSFVLRHSWIWLDKCASLLYPHKRYDCIAQHLPSTEPQLNEN